MKLIKLFLKMALDCLNFDGGLDVSAYSCAPLAHRKEKSLKTIVGKGDFIMKLETAGSLLSRIICNSLMIGFVPPETRQDQMYNPAVSVCCQN